MRHVALSFVYWFFFQWALFFQQQEFERSLIWIWISVLLLDLSLCDFSPTILGFSLADHVVLKENIAILVITKPCLFSLSSPWIPPGIKLGSESYFGDFVDGLGPAQIVGRQVLASPSMGDIQLAMFDRKGVLEVEVVRAKGLLPKPGSKILPGMNILLLKSPFYDLKVHFFIFFLWWSFFFSF